MNKKLALATAALALTACSTQIPAGEQAVLVDDYVMVPADPVVYDCQGPETQKWLWSAKSYKYPSRQISWDATVDESAERQPYVVVSSATAPAELSVPVTVVFDLTTDCEKLKQFHRDFGTKYSGWINDGTAGWVQMLNYVIGQPMEQTLISVAQKYTWREIWNDEKVRVEFTNALKTQLPKASAARTNGQEYFTNFAVTVGKPDPVDDGLKQAIIAEQKAIADARAAEAKGVADANAKKAKAEADLAASIAETRVAEQQALQKAADIRGYPDVDAYLRDQAIKAGKNPFQPTYVVPQGG